MDGGRTLCMRNMDTMSSEARSHMHARSLTLPARPPLLPPFPLASLFSRLGSGALRCATARAVSSPDRLRPVRYIYSDKGHFDVLIENDDLDRAVGELSRHLTEWFPKIKAGESS